MDWRAITRRYVARHGSRAAAAAALGVSPRTVEAWAQGRREPSSLSPEQMKKLTTEQEEKK